jgi:hypothetical protein
MPRHHLLISGTGRAGTSFLVQYLTELGHDTHIRRRGAGAWHDTDAQAGFEDFPLPVNLPSLPYVIKSPWVAFDPEQSLAADRVILDAIVIPMRGLEEAAASRVVTERRAMHQAARWMADLDRGFDVWGHTPGGALASLHPLDQARLLAVAFHRLVQFAVLRDIPLVLLDFPRMVQDADYLFDRLLPVLPCLSGAGPDRAAARAAHARVADPSRLRAGAELAGLRSAPEDAPDLDRAALRREVARLRAEGDRLRAEVQAAAAAPPPEPPPPGRLSRLMGRRPARARGAP